ncbi:hypothetical protein OQA88_5152 [Cercophora sp. LCS_1]
MHSDWVAKQRTLVAKINQHNTGNPTPPTPSEDLIITTLSAVDTSNIPTISNQIIDYLISAGPPVADAWYFCHSLLLSLAQSTSSTTTHQNLTTLLFTLATSTTPNPEITTTINTLYGFGWSVRDLWNGPKALSSYRESPALARAEWTNLNRFMAHVSVQNRETPVEPLKGWVEDFGMWTIVDGLESKGGWEDYVEAAAGWLEIAGRDIYQDGKWGGRDGVATHLVREGELWAEKVQEGAGYAERWAFWRARLTGFARDENVEEGVREVCKRVEGVMAGFEK